MDTNFTFSFSPKTDFSYLRDKLKNVVLPQRVFIENNKIVVWGYFTSYNPKVSDEKLIEELQEHGFDRIANSDCDYLLFVWDKLEQRLVVGVDNKISFSCYFFVLDKEIVFSSDFSVIKDVAAERKTLVADLDGLLTYITSAVGFQITEKTILSSVKQ